MSHVSASPHSSLTHLVLHPVTKGVSANMLKISSKRRRTQAQIQADKEAAAQQEAQQQAKDAEIHALQQQVMQLSEDAKTGALATDMMSQFINTGLVQHTGEDEFIVHGSHGDKSFSASKKK